MLNIFSCASWLCVCLIKNCLFGFSACFLIGLVLLLLNCISSLHILDINCIPDIRLAYIFSHSVSCLFILMMVSFTVWKLFSLMDSYLLFFAFVSLSFGVRTTNTLLAQMSWRLPSMSSSRSVFIVSGLTLKSLIHFRLVFISDVR